MSTSNTSAGFSNNGSGIFHRPFKGSNSNVFIDAFNKNTRENLEFDLGSFRFDLNQFNFDIDDIENPNLEDLAFNMKLTAVI